MSSLDEPITVYGIMFDPPEGWNLGQVDEAFRTFPEQYLFESLGLAVVVGTAFGRAFGSEDIRTRAVAAAMGPLVTELGRRGFPDLARHFNHKAAFDGWRATTALGGPTVDTVPTHRLSRMRVILRDAAARLGSRETPDEADMTAALDQVLESVNTLLRCRGVLAEETPRRGLQA